jgi:TolA-binding protein
MRVVAQAVWLALVTSALAFAPAARADSGADRFAVAAAHYRAGRWAEACSAFQALLSSPQIQHDTIMHARFYYGEALAQQGRYADAREQFAQLLAGEPEHRFGPQALFRRAEAAYLGGDTAAAMTDLDDFCKRFPDSELLAYALMYRAHLEAAEGQTQQASTSFAAAAERFERRLEGHPDEPQRDGPARVETASALATCYARVGRLRDARDALSKARSAGLESTSLGRAATEVAEAAFAQGDYETAAAEFESLSASRDDAPLACRGYLGLGWCRFKRGDWAAAAEAFGHVVDATTNSPAATEAALMRGRALERLGRFDDALAMYQQVMRREPSGTNHVEALWSAARAYDQLKQPSQAATLYRRLINSYPEFAESSAAVYRLAWLEHTAGHAEEAGQLWQRLRAEHPKSQLAADATLRLAEQALADKQFDQASVLLAEVAASGAPRSLEPHSLALAARLAMAQGQWGDVEAPLARLDDLLADAPDEELERSAKYWRGEAAYRLGQFAEAVERLQTLVESPQGRQQPWSATAELRLAQAHAQLKQWQESRAVAERISQYYPQFDEQYEADYLVGRAMIAEADLVSARAMFAKALAAPRAAKSETAAMANFMMAETYFHQEDFGSALGEYQKVQRASDFPRWQAAALLQAAKCHESLGRWTDAVHDYDDLLREFANSSLADEARSRVESARRHAQATNGKLK